MTTEETEYEALRKLSIGERRYRVFLYAVTVTAVVLSAVAININITRKIDGLVTGSVARGNQRNTDQKTIAKESIRYITCIFVIPIDQRTADTQQKCFDQADLPGGLNRSDFSPYVSTGPTAPSAISLSPASGVESPSQQSVASSSSSPESIIVQPVAQPDTSQSPPEPTQTGLLQSTFGNIQNVLKVLSGG